MFRGLLVIGLLLGTTIPSLAAVSNDIKDWEKGVVVIDRDKGYYVDGRGQVPEHARIAPQHEENIPVPHPTQTVVGWRRYYDINKEGQRPMGYQTPLVPNYNVHYSEREAEPYTKEDFIKVWCNGEADYKRGTCTTSDKVYYYYYVEDWAFAVAGTPFRDLKRTKDGKDRAYVFYAQRLGMNAEAMHSVKQWAEMLDMDIHFVLIDAYIPQNWLLE